MEYFVRLTTNNLFSALYIAADHNDVEVINYIFRDFSFSWPFYNADRAVDGFPQITSSLQNFVKYCNFLVYLHILSIFHYL